MIACTQAQFYRFIRQEPSRDYLPPPQCPECPQCEEPNCPPPIICPPEKICEVCPPPPPPVQCPLPPPCESITTPAPSTSSDYSDAVTGYQYLPPKIPFTF